MRAQRRRALPPRARRRRPGHELRPAGCCCACSRPSTATSSRSATTTRRSTASAAPRRKNMRDFQAEHPDATVVRLERQLPLPASAILDAARAVVEPQRGPHREAARRGRRRRPRARSRSGAARTSARRRRRGRRVERLIAREGVAPERIAVLVRSVRTRGPGGRRRAGGARASATGWSARRRSSSAPRCATCSRGCGCSPTRATRAPSCARWRARRSSCGAVDLARCTQIARRRKLDMVAALRAALESPQIPPEARERIAAFLRLHRAARRGARHDAARPVRAPADRAPRAAQPAAVHRAGRVVERLVNLARFARARDRLRAARAAGDAARVRRATIAAVAEAGPARGGGRRPATGRARGAGADDARGARASSSTASTCSGCSRAHAGRAPRTLRADPRRAAEGGAAAGEHARRTSPRCAGCCTSR